MELPTPPLAQFDNEIANYAKQFVCNNEPFTHGAQALLTGNLK